MPPMTLSEVIIGAGGVYGVDLRAALGQAGEREIGGIAGAVVDGGGVEIDGGGGEAEVFWPAADGVAEGERIGAGAAGIGGGAAIVEGKRRGAAGDRDRLVEVEGQGDGLAGIEIAVEGDSVNDEMVGVVVSICGPLWVQTGEREIGGIAGAVSDGGGVEIDGGGGKARGVLAGGHGVAEGERIAAGAARIGGDAAIVERERGGAAGTVTASLRLRVKVTVLPALRSPLDGDLDQATRWSALWCRSAGRSGSGRRARDWRHCRRRR